MFMVSVKLADHDQRKDITAAQLLFWETSGLGLNKELKQINEIVELVRANPDGGNASGKLQVQDPIDVFFNTGEKC